MKTQGWWKMASAVSSLPELALGGPHRKQPVSWLPDGPILQEGWHIPPPRPTWSLCHLPYHGDTGRYSVSMEQTPAGPGIPKASLAEPMGPRGDGVQPEVSCRMGDHPKGHF
jgi:hypothetical protein